tara:strand:+ start:365 stop:850 length:486 start_codon:yes stop_codon:yes gene_type:complete
MLSVTSSYAIRAATSIAQREKAMPASEIAEAVEVPLRYLQQILKRLVQAGILSATRGVGGGFRLQIRADEVFLGQIVRIFDDVERQTTCPFGREEMCSVPPNCALHDQWMHVVSPYKDLLEKVTLADLADTCPDVSLDQIRVLGAGVAAPREGIPKKIRSF